MGPASNRWAWFLTKIPEAKLPWATWARSSGQDSTASLCPTPTVTLASTIMTLGIVQLLLSKHPRDPTWDGIEWQQCYCRDFFCCAQCAQLFTQISGFAVVLCCAKREPSEYGVLATSCFHCVFSKSGKQPFIEICQMGYRMMAYRIGYWIRPFWKTMHTCFLPSLLESIFPCTFTWSYWVSNTLLLSQVCCICIALFLYSILTDKYSLHMSTLYDSP